MKVVSIYAATPYNEIGLFKITRRIYDALGELEMEIEEFNLNNMMFPFYEGEDNEKADEVFEAIIKADGIILASTVSIFSPSPLMHNFISHLESYNREIFKNKNCMIVSISEEHGETEAAQYLGKVVNHYGGFDSIKISLNEDIAVGIENNPDNESILDRQIEDFYRYLRQKRKFFIPTEKEQNITIEANTKSEKPIVSKDIIEEQLNLNMFSEEHEDEIDEITEFFLKKYSPSKTDDSIVEEPDTYTFEKLNKNVALKPREKSVLQYVKSMPRRYKNQLFSGSPFVVSINISGNEEFSCYLEISKESCEFFDGTHSSPDISVFSDDEIWADIMKGKRTTQKSFMTGQIKVKGNFVLLTNLDKYFDPVL